MKFHAPTGAFVVDQEGLQRAAGALGIYPGQPFPIPGARLVEPPRCHDEPMRLAGPAGARHWACSRCASTAPLEGKA